MAEADDKQDSEDANEENIDPVQKQCVNNVRMFLRKF